MKNILKILLMTFILLFSSIACGKPSEEEIRNLMETHLLERYGESFVIEGIGIQNANGQKFYTAKIYPKSIVGTSKENDEYYRATVNIDILSFGRLRKVGDTYGEIKTKDEAEEYLLPKAKELFGNKIRIKTNPVLKEKDDSDNLWYPWVTPSFQFIKDKVKENPEKYRLQMEIYLYIFDRIDNEKEKEERRQQIFDFIQYLKKEGLFEYTMIDFLIINEKVLAPSYVDYKYKLSYFDRESVIINKKEYEVLPKEIINPIINTLTNEIKNIENKEIVELIKNIYKNDLTDETDYTDVGIAKDNIQFYSRNYSEKNVKENYKSAYEQGEIKLNSYEKIDSIDFEYYKKYNFILEK